MSEHIIFGKLVSDPVPKTSVADELQTQLVAGIEMCLDYFLCLALVYLVAPSRGHGDEAFAGLEQISKLNLTQVTLIAENATARCNSIPNLCNWQLHLFGGHAFSVPLKQEEEEAIKNKPTPAVFTLSLPDDSKELLIYAEVELSPRPMKKRRKRRLRPRRPAFFYVGKLRQIRSMNEFL